MEFLEYFYEQLAMVLKTSKLLGYEQVKTIFLIALDDFFNNKISIHFLSSVAAQLYYELKKPNDFYSNSEWQKLGSALDDAEELEYYQKHQNENQMYERRLKHLKEYYQENKKILEDLNVQ